MSDNLGKRIKVIAVIIGTVGAVTGFAAALKYFSEGNLFFACVFLIYAILSIMLMIPLFLAGSSADAIEAENKKLRNLSDKIAMIEKSSRYATSPIDKYSPVAGRRRAPASDASDDDVAPMGVATAERKVAPYPSGDLSSSKGSIELESEKEMGTIKSVFASSSDRIDSDTLITDIPKPSMKSEAESAFYTTSSIDMIKVNRKDNSVTRFLAPSSSTIAAGGLHTVAVTEAGKVLAAGYGTYGQCNVSAWTSIVSVAAGNHHTVGLRSNGTCVATGYSGYGQCEVDMWRNICAVSAGVGHTVGLLENGTCVATGDNTYGQCNVSDWEGIIAISAGYNYTVGLRADGTIVAVGANTDGTWGGIRWGSICAVASGGLHTLGLKSDGTCVAVGNNANDQCDVSRWQNVRAVAAGNYHSVGLLANGKVVAVGYNGYGQCNVSEWQNVVAIAAGRNHTVGLTRSGILLSTGDNTYGQCNLRNFTDIKINK
mgnify:FL=1